MNIPAEILWGIIKILSYCIVGLLSLGVTVFAFFHKSLLKRLDSIDANEKSRSGTEGIQAEKIESLTKGLQDHETRLRQVERKP